MKAIFAVGDAATAVRLLTGHRALVSYAYVGTSWIPTSKLGELAKVCTGLVYDSGAFTEWQRALKGQTPKGVTLEGYAEWLTKAPAFDWALGLDVIGDAQASLDNFAALKNMLPGRMARRIVPVWHESDPLEHLDAYVAAADLVGLGRTEGRRSEKKSRVFYDEAFNRFPAGTFHALGNSNPATLEPYPFASFDSTAWQRDSTYAQSHGWPWSHVKKDTRMQAYVEACEGIKHKPTQGQLDMWRRY